MKKKRLIEVDGISKKFWIRSEGPQYSLKSTLHQLMTGKSKTLSRKPFWAVENVSFTLDEGEIVGILGHNGSGKSTLLKMIAQVTEPTQGKIVLHGRLGAMLEVGTGMHPDLTGRDNIYFCGAILGMKRADIRAQLDAIVEFAEIEAFLDVPLKRYSSGMALRLASSVLFHLRTDFLVLDEVLSVGDIDFQARCFEKVKEIAQEGRSVLCVTHHEIWVSTYCQRALLMHHGRLLDDGEPEAVVAHYHSLLKKDKHHMTHVESQVHETVGCT
jgi:lipopolysaccharide transport system ATP-binding protein